MLSSIKRKINKTPTKNTSTIIREVEVIDSDIVTLLLSSNYLGEGVFGFEIAAETAITEEYLVTPSLFREPLGEEVYRNFEYLRNDTTDLYCYNIVLRKPSFLPLFIQEPYSILDNLKLLCSEHKQMYIQLLFTKRTDKWNKTFVQQYDAYLEGNDFPSEGFIKRKMQGKFLKVMDKISGFYPDRELVEEIEQKIVDHGYRFEFRIVLHTKENPEEIETEIRDILKEMNFFNELGLHRVRNKKEFLDHFLSRRYSPHSADQILSESELIVISSGNHSIIESKPKTMRQAQEIIKDQVMNKPLSVSTIQLLPVAKKKEIREMDSEIANMIEPALRTAKVIKEQNQQVIVKEVELGPTVQVVTFEIPKGILFTDLIKKQKDIEFFLGKPQMSITPGKEPNTISFLIPCEKREVIYLVELLQNPEFIEFAENNPLPLICGVDIFNKPVFKCLTQGPHLLVAGATNSGKSVFMNALLIVLILMRKPDELRLVLIDPKKVELNQYEGFPHVESIITDMDEAYETLEGLVKETERRYAEFAKLGVKNIQNYNKKSPKLIPYIVVAVDEYADLHMAHPEVDDCIQRITQLARAAGVHLILATQRPSVDVLNGVIKSNIPSQVSFALNQTVDYKTVFGKGIPYNKLLGYGDGVVRYMGQTEDFIRFQSPVISLSSDEEAETIERIKAYYNGESVEGLNLLSITKEPPEEPIDKLRRIILETGETRSDPLQNQMGIRMTEVLDLRKKLVEEGTLRKEGNKFFVNEKEENNP